MRILVTGADGQLGRYLRRAAVGASDDYLFATHRDLDITDRQQVLRYVADQRVDVIINAAAYTDVERAEAEESAAYAVNAEAVGYLAEAARKNDALVIHLSTDYVFMGGCCAVLTEQSHPQPINAYGRTKLAGEELLRASGCHWMVVRTAWLYGCYGKNFLRTILRLSEERQVLRVVNDQIGSPTYAADLAAALVRLIAERRFVEGIYHYTNLGECSWWEFATEICRLAGRSVTVEPCSSAAFPTKARRPHNSVLDKTKFMKTFGQEIPHWRESLKTCINEL